MNRSITHRESGLGWGFAASALLHLALAALALVVRFQVPRYTEAPVYYVDVVNLPVASPRAGSPTVGGAPPEPPPPASQAMTISRPAPRAPAAVGKKSSTTADTGKEFEDRLSALKRNVDERRQEAAFDALRRKVNGSGRAEPAGMPGATGTQAGSDYAAYIQSRLRDAFRYTIAHQAKTPEVVIRLTIDPHGRVARQRIERSTGDRIFEESVMKAIAMAEETFTPPPSGGEFETGFIFRPEGVGKR